MHLKKCFLKMQLKCVYKCIFFLKCILNAFKNVKFFPKGISIIFISKFISFLSKFNIILSK